MEPNILNQVGAQQNITIPFSQLLECDLIEVYETTAEDFLLQDFVKVRSVAKIANSGHCRLTGQQLLRHLRTNHQLQRNITLNASV
jgi:hypothetical protein